MTSNFVPDFSISVQIQGTANGPKYFMFQFGGVTLLKLDIYLICEGFIAKVKWPIGQAVMFEKKYSPNCSP